MISKIYRYIFSIIFFAIFYARLPTDKQTADGQTPAKS